MKQLAKASQLDFREEENTRKKVEELRGSKGAEKTLKQQNRNIQLAIGIYINNSNNKNNNIVAIYYQCIQLVFDNTDLRAKAER